MKKNIKDIKNDIKKNNLVYWFNIKNNKPILIASGNKKNEASNNLIDKINKKMEKYINSKLWRISISFHNSDENKLIFGEVLVKVENYFIYEFENEIKIKKTPQVGYTGSIWFKKKWLEYNGWDNKYIINIINKLLQKDSKKLKLTAPNIYHLLF